jgi:hypothetical protein
MSLQYVRDDLRRRIKITLRSPVTVAELFESVERQFADGGWQYGILADARLMSHALEVDDIRALVSRVRAFVDANGPRGPVAFVARHSQVIGAGQLYRMFGGEPDSLEVFWDIPEAQRWLDDRTAQCGQPPSQREPSA